METELKLAARGDILESLTNQVQTHFGADVVLKEKLVYNDYFDTDDAFLRHRKMGFRVRVQGDLIEQTIKTQGKVVGGLHQRPEYNVALQNAIPDLRKFPNDIWPEDVDVEQLNKQLSKVFSTHFTRYQFDIKFNNSLIELVYDKGTISTDNDELPINEIELELKSGDDSDLFSLSLLICQDLPVYLSNSTKAARGYQLSKGRFAQSKYLPKFLALEEDDTTEDGLTKAMSCALDHWQYHQGVFLQTGELKALTQIRESMSLLLQSVALYLPVLQSEDLLKLHKDVLRLTQQWVWQDELKSIHKLNSRKGPFSRRIPKDGNLVNYLLGRKEGLISTHDPEALLFDSLCVHVQLETARILNQKPWREQTDGAEIPVRKHANGWLSQTWQTVMQSLPSDDAMDSSKYLALEIVLKQSLTNGFLLGDLFTETRGTFRAPWLDLLHGIDELKAIDFLYLSAINIDLDDPVEFAQWLEEKRQTLLSVMERSRQIAMQADTYW